MKLTSDDEIDRILRSHGVPESVRVDIRPADHVGHYIEIRPLQYGVLRRAVEGNELAWSMYFSPPSTTVFIPPYVKGRCGNITCPVYLEPSSAANRSQVFQDLLDRGVPLKKAKVVNFYLYRILAPAEREELLRELNADERVLFALKEYMQGDIC